MRGPVRRFRGKRRRVPHDPVREAKRASRDAQGWQKRSPLIRMGGFTTVASPALRFLYHDGSTVAERRKRTANRESPWVD